MQEFSLNDKRAERVVTILRQLVVHQLLDVRQVATELSTIRNDIDSLVSKGWVEPFGSTKGRKYRLTEIGQKWVSKRV
jgi:hypothetical protein